MLRSEPSTTRKPGPMRFVLPAAGIHLSLGILMRVRLEILKIVSQATIATAILPKRSHTRGPSRLPANPSLAEKMRGDRPIGGVNMSMRGGSNERSIEGTCSQRERRASQRSPDQVWHNIRRWGHLRQRDYSPTNSWYCSCQKHRTH